MAKIPTLCISLLVMLLTFSLFFSHYLGAIGEDRNVDRLEIQQFCFHAQLSLYHIGLIQRLHHNKCCTNLYLNLLLRTVKTLVKKTLSIPSHPKTLP